MDTNAGTLRVGFVGAGTMGGAIARGLLETGALPPSRLGVADPSESVRDAFASKGAAAFRDGVDLLGSLDPQLVFLAVKPQALPKVVSPLASRLEGRIVASIAAGVRVATLESLMPASRVIRCMPNLPMAAHSGAVAITAGSKADDGDVELVRTLLSGLGVAEVMSEAQLDAAGVVTGCSPAFFALFVDCLTRAGIEAGLPAKMCRTMVEATMRGTAEQLVASGEHPRSYMERVSSPGGTTIAALRELEAPTFAAVTSAVDVALAKTLALASSSGR